MLCDDRENTTENEIVLCTCVLRLVLFFLRVCDAIGLDQDDKLVEATGVRVPVSRRLLDFWAA